MSVYSERAGQAITEAVVKASKGKAEAREGYEELLAALQSKNTSYQSLVAMFAGTAQRFIELERRFSEIHEHGVEAAQWVGPPNKKRPE